MTPLGDDSRFSSAQSSGSLVQTISCSFQHLVQHTSFHPNSDTLWRIAKLRDEIAQISEANPVDRNLPGIPTAKVLAFTLDDVI
jgi:hypothetical protein